MIAGPVAGAGLPLRTAIAWSASGRGTGSPAVALLSPLLVGAPLGTVLALLLGAPRRRLLGWMVASVVLWGTVLTGATAFGLSVFGG